MSALTVKRLLRSWLASTGYTIVRTPRRSALGAEVPSRSAGLHVEMIGPPGAGKTTITNIVSRTAGKDWLVREDLRTARLDRNGTYRDLYKKILLRKLETIDTSENSFRVARYISYLSDMILNDIRIRHGNLGSGVLLDEGVSQVFKPELLELSDDEFKDVMGDRFLVSLQPRDPGSIVKQIKLRFFERNPGKAAEPDAVLLAKVESSKRNCEAVVEKARKVGIRVIELTVEDGVARNARSLEKVLQSAAGPE